MKLTFGNKNILNKKEETLKLIKQDKKSNTFFDGEKFIARYYKDNINYFDNNSFKPIETTLIENENGFEIKNNSFKISFFKDIIDNKLLEIRKDNCKIILSAKNSLFKSQNNNSIIYHDEINNIDLEYIVKTTKIKENIILNKDSDISNIVFQLYFENLVFCISNDGKCLELKNKENGKSLFSIPSPYMIDKNGVMTDEIYYEITQENDNLLTLKLIINNEWLENRLFPVKIDPEFDFLDGEIDLYGYYNTTYTGSADENGNLYNDSIFLYDCYIYRGANYNTSLTENIGSWCGNDLKIYCYCEEGDLIHVDSSLTILKNRLPKNLLSNIVKAKVILKVTNNTDGGDVAIDGDIIYCSPNQEIEIDITERLTLGNVTIPLVDFHDRGGFSDKNITFEPPILELYFSDYIHRLEVETPPFKTNYISGEKFESDGMQLALVYYSENKKEIILPDACSISPKDSLTTYDDSITITYDEFSINYPISVLRKGFNDRKPDDNFENVYSVCEVDPATGKNIANTFKYIRLELHDGANNDPKRRGTPLNAENFNKNLIVNAENIYGIINDNNLPEYLRNLKN